MIEIIPSISVMGGKCVRISQGNFAKPVAYGEQPLEIAQRFEEHGIKKIHLIDLDGAKAGKGVNFDTLQLLSGYTSLHINYGGGMTTDGDLSKAFEYGAKMVTAGSVACNNRDLFSSWVISYGRHRICMGADSMKGKIKVRGWQDATEVELEDLVKHHYERSVQYVKCADVERDGQLQGPNVDIYTRLMERFPELKILASGGVRSIDDIKRLDDLGVYGVIFGRAYYENKISLTEIERFMGNLKTV